MREANSQSLRLAGWGSLLTCFTAALGTWLAEREEKWWRPLLDGGPYLALERRGPYWLFEHASEPWLPKFDLAFHAADNWNDAAGAIAAEIGAQGSVIVAGDVWQLPWQRGYRNWHAPHWLVVHGRGPYIVEDALEMMTPNGMQNPLCLHVDLAACELQLRAMNVPDPIAELREESLAGREPLHSGARYRWLAHSPSRKPCTPAGPRGESCSTLAAHFEAHAISEDAYAQADDLWQALRQRELLIAAMEHDADLLDAVGTTHWQSAVEHWRRVPPLLLHARMRAASGAPNPARPLIDTLRRLSTLEGRHLVSAPYAAAEWFDR